MFAGGRFGAGVVAVLRAAQLVVADEVRRAALVLLASSVCRPRCARWSVSIMIIPSVQFCSAAEEREGQRLRSRRQRCVAWDETG